MAQAKLNDVAAKNETRTAAYQAKTTLHDDSAKQLKEILDVRTAPPAGICFFLRAINREATLQSGSI